MDLLVNQVPDDWATLLGYVAVLLAWLLPTPRALLKKVLEKKKGDESK